MPNPLEKLLETILADPEKNMGLTIMNGEVILAFRKRVRSVAFTPDVARDIAAMLLGKAEECDGRSAQISRDVTNRAH